MKSPISRIPSALLADVRPDTTRTPPTSDTRCNSDSASDRSSDRSIAAKRRRRSSVSRM